jgi:oxalate decarboxylase/phosphoglucose isomerase-like protein (cupin superfamily)
MVVVAPKGITHQIINDGEGELKALFIFSPAGPEKDFVIK